jgi:uncharacterized protein (TIGR02266 family)
MKDLPDRFREYVRLDRLRGGAGLSPAELKRWMMLKRQLSQHFSPGLPDRLADQRDSVRVPARLSVSFPTESELARSLMGNLSRRGVFVRTKHLLEIGSRFELCVHVGDPPQDVRIQAEVVSHNVGPSFESQEPGMGLRFLGADDGTEKQLDELYERLVS